MPGGTTDLALVIVMVIQCKPRLNILPYFKQTSVTMWSFAAGCPGTGSKDGYYTSLQILEACKNCTPEVKARAKALMASFKVCT